MTTEIMNRPTRRGVLCVVAAIVAYPARAGEVSYVNPRFGTTITFPGEVFSLPQPPSENSDGMSWASPDGAWLGVWGQYNALDHDEKALLDFLAPEFDEVTYGKAGKGFVVLSGLDDGKVFYQRTNFGRDGVLHSMLMRYPQHRHANFDRLAIAVAASLKGP